MILLQSDQIAESLSMLGLSGENKIGDQCIITGLFGKNKEEQKVGVYTERMTFQPELNQHC